MTKEELKEYDEIKRERNHLERKIKEIEWELYGARSQNLDGMPRTGTGGGDVLERKLDRKSELLEMYQNKKKELDAALVRIEEAIEKLEPRERLLVRLHYLDGMKWEKVAVEMGYSWRQVHRIHADALKKLKEDSTKS